MGSPIGCPSSARRGVSLCTITQHHGLKASLPLGNSLPCPLPRRDRLQHKVPPVQLLRQLPLPGPLLLRGQPGQAQDHGIPPGLPRRHCRQDLLLQENLPERPRLWCPPWAWPTSFTNTPAADLPGLLWPGPVSTVQTVLSINISTILRTKPQTYLLCKNLKR